MEALAKLPGVQRVKGPMCHWGLQAEDRRGDHCGESSYVRKMTGWLTNSEELARLLQKTCSNLTATREWHRHVHLVGGLAKQAQVYPPALVAAVLKTLKKHMRAKGELSAFEQRAAGPVPDQETFAREDWQEFFEEDWDTFVDDVHGTPLRADLVREAREEELRWVRKEGIYLRVPLRQCYERTGKAPLDTRWIDVNKGDNRRPAYRSRMVVREIKARKKLMDRLPAASLFSATPPVESFFLLMSVWMSVRRSKTDKPLKVGLWDISRAHFMEKAEREIYVKIPEEDRNDDDEEPMVGLLQRSMYGTQDASNLFQQGYVKLLSASGFTFGSASYATFHSVGLDARGLVHGDDFAVLGDDEALRKVDEILRSKYTVKWTAKIGPDPDDDKEGVFLNRVIRYCAADAGGPERVEVEADARHSAKIVEELGLTHGRSVDTPAVKRTAAEIEMAKKEPIVGRSDQTLFRSVTMRAAYLSLDRPDLIDAVKSLATSMKGPKASDMSRLKRLGRYLLGVPTMVRIFNRQALPQQLRVYGDSDWAGDMVSRKSTSGFAAMNGTHLILAKGNLQSTIALSSCEAEFYAAVKSLSFGLFLREILRDWGFAGTDLELHTDSSSAKSFMERRGLGKNRHVQTKYLWIQERLALGDFNLKKVSTHVNLGDLMTKPLGGAAMRGHLKRMNLRTDGQKSDRHRDLLRGTG